MSQVTGKAKKDVKVTVGLCVKNCEKTVKAAIESIINQKYPKELMRIVVVDGSSKDKTLSIVKRMISKTDIKTKVYSDEGNGLGYARQMVVDHADGRYIVFVDGDVELLNDFVQEQVGFMEQNPKVGTAPGRWMYKEGTLLSTLWNLYHHVAYNKYVGNDATIYRFEVLRQLGGFDKSIKGASEDLDLIARIQAKGWMLSVNEKARFYHNSRENLRDFWVERAWFGYGGHYISHKHEHWHPLRHNVPLGSFIEGLKWALKAYELTRRKISFLIPLQFVFGSVAYWFGFIKSHLDDYGHEIS